MDYNQLKPLCKCGRHKATFFIAGDLIQCTGCNATAEGINVWNDTNGASQLILPAKHGAPKVRFHNFFGRDCAYRDERV